MAPRRRTGRNAGVAAALTVLLAAQPGPARAEGPAAAPQAGGTLASVPAPAAVPAITTIPDYPFPPVPEASAP
jgi:hypothetical protein